MNIVDVGAGRYNKYADWLTKHSSLKIYAFEPHPDNFEKLECIKQSLEPQSKKRLFLFNILISNKNGTIPFHINNDPSSSSVLELVGENVKKWRYPIGRRYFKPIKTIDAKSLTLKQVFDTNKINTVDLLNIDTQGDALTILESLDFRRFSSIKQIVVKAHVPGCIELYKGQCDSYEVTRLLKKRYFQLFKSLEYSQGQEQILNFLNEPMKNRGAPLYGFAE